MTIRQLHFDQFSNAIALDMGMKVLAHAKAHNQNIAVQIDRLHHTVFLHVGETLNADKLNWLRRKINTAKHFEESSLAIKQDLHARDRTLCDPYQLDSKDHLAMGGAIPIVVKHAGMVGVIAVSGLTDVEDHQIIIDALAEYCVAE